MSEESSATAIVVSIFVVLLVLFLIISLKKSIYIVNEKEVIVIERFGQFLRCLTPGFEVIIPWIDRPRCFTDRYYLTTNQGENQLVEKRNQTRISTQNEVLDFPRQNVISRDNAAVHLDALLSYKIERPERMIYGCVNLPHLLSKLLQAQLRNVAGTLDVDQIVEESSSMNILTGLMDQEANRWGIKILFVKVQRVEMGELADVLAKKKNADLKNKEVIIQAKAAKQKMVIEAEGKRDSMVKEAEGSGQEMLAKARGKAQAIVNQAHAEARSLKEISRALAKDGENPAKYLLAIKYLEVLTSLTSMSNTEVMYMPKNVAFIETAKHFGLNTVLPARS